MDSPFTPSAHPSLHFLSTPLQNLIRRQCFQLKRLAPVYGCGALQRFNLMQTWLLVWRYMRTMTWEMDKKKTWLQMALSMGGLLPPSRHVPTLQKGCCYHLCPCYCTWGEKRVYFYQHHIAKEMWAGRGEWKQTFLGNVLYRIILTAIWAELGHITLFMEKYTGCCHSNLLCICISRTVIISFLINRPIPIKCEKIVKIPTVFLYSLVWQNSPEAKDS